MNKKHFLIVLVMVAVASASLFGGFQAYRYNRSMMNKSVFSSNIEASADARETNFWDDLRDGLSDFGNDINNWWNRLDWMVKWGRCSITETTGSSYHSPTGSGSSHSRTVNYDGGHYLRSWRVSPNQGNSAHRNDRDCFLGHEDWYNLYPEIDE